MLVKYNEKDVIDIISQIPFKKGSGVFIHSSMYRMGFPENTSYSINWWLNNLIKKINNNSTIGVPTFNFNFCNGSNFCRDITPSSMGIFSEFFRKNKDSYRTKHPINSCSFIGKDARYLSTIDSLNSYSKESIFQKMYEMDFDILLLGASFQSISFVHLAEYNLDVSYRYLKIFEGLCKDKISDKEILKSYSMFVRDLNLNPILKLENVKTYMLNKDQTSVKKIESNKIKNITLLNSKIFVNACMEMLEQNEYSLLENN